MSHVSYGQHAARPHWWSRQRTRCPTYAFKAAATGVKGLQRPSYNLANHLIHLATSFNGAAEVTSTDRSQCSPADAVHSLYSDTTIHRRQFLQVCAVLAACGGIELATCAPTCAALVDEDITVSVFQKANTSVVSIANYIKNGSSNTLEGVGSGFVWDKYGHVVTNYHCISKFVLDKSGKQVMLRAPLQIISVYNFKLWKELQEILMAGPLVSNCSGCMCSPECKLLKLPAPVVKFQPLAADTCYCRRSSVLASMHLTHQAVAAQLCMMPP